MSDIREANGHPLRVTRAQHNLTLQELSEAIDVSVATLSRIENGLQKAGPDTRKRLVKYFKKTSQELGLLKPSKKDPSNEYEHLETKSKNSISPTLNKEVSTIQALHACFPYHLAVTDFVIEAQEQLQLPTERTVPRYLEARV